MRSKITLLKHSSTSLFKRYSSWFNPAAWALILVAIITWQCKKDDFAGETVGICPRVVSSSPTQGDTNVVVRQRITVNFNEDLNPISVNALTIVIQHGGKPILGTVTYEEKRATFLPAQYLDARTMYTLTVTTGIEDMEGNNMIKDYFCTFKTGNAIDTIHPTVISTEPTNGAADVVLNKTITAVFSETMDSASINSNTFILKKGTTAITGVVNYNGITASFNPSASLEPNTTYTGVITPSASDLAGNKLESSFIWTFNTGDAIDTIRPRVIATDPDNDAINVAFNKTVTATFSEPMNPTSVNSLAFTVKKGTTVVPGTILYDGVTVAFNPVGNFTPNTVYSCNMNTRAKDLAGNALLANYSWTFTTGDAADTTRPFVTVTDPTNEATNVAFSKNVTATFSETMNPATITASTFTVSKGATAISGTLSYTGTTAIFNPTVDLTPNTTYTGKITTTAKDMSGNALAANYIWTFTTNALPRVLSTDPANNAVNVLLNKTISATFSESMNPTTITDLTFVVKQGTNFVSGVVGYSGTTAIFNPANDLVDGVLYTATITTSAKDLSGNSIAANYNWTFTTGNAPAVILTSPTNNATSVAFDKTLSATFSEAMDEATITDATFSLKRGTTVIAGTVSYSGTTATFNPTADLVTNAIYTATITTGAKNPAGNGLLANYVWSFTTDATPTVILTDPTSNATNVALNKTVTADFSEAMNPLTITAATFTLKQGTNVVAGTVAYSGTVATFNPSANFLPSTVYTATITTGAENPAGTGLAANYVWSFTTGSAPTVVSTDPSNNASSVPANKVLKATFSETMDIATITAATFTLKQGTNAVAGAISYAGTSAIFTPSANLLANTVYTATITTGAKNPSGNGLTADYVWSFTTDAKPTVILTDPLNNASGIALNKTLSATFSEAMDASTITAATFSLKEGANVIGGVINYSGTTAIFNPSADLQVNKLYTATITTGAKNVAGAALAANYVWTFTTGAAPTVILTDPLNNATSVSLDKVLKATFSENMDASTITASTFTLKQGANTVAGAITYTGTAASFNPTANLTSNTLYTATITTGAKNTSGTALATDFVWTFTTDAAPTVTNTDPNNNAIGIAVNKTLSASFSEAMDASTITATTFTLKQGANTVAGAINYSGTTAIFNPTTDLLLNTLYTATITTGAKNLLGTALATNYVWTFTTGAAPTVILTDPLNNATGVALDKIMKATFSENMDAATITSSTFTLKQGANVIAGTVSSTGAVASFNPTVSLTTNTLYTATITTGAKDVSGAALANNFTWTFTTDVAPTVISTDPLNNATGIAVNKTLSASFSEAMDASTITASTFTLKQGANTVAGAINYSGTTAIFNPTTDLLLNTLYTATITTGAKNLLGTALATNYVWTFTTGAAPTVILTDPLNNATGVALDKIMKATFSENMDAATITSSTFTLKQGANVIAGTVSSTGTVASFNPTVDLATNTLYTATITTGAKDVSGAALANDYVWTFRTDVAPTVTSTDPLNNATNVALNKTLSASFSEAMDASTITASTFTLKQGANNVAGVINYSGTTAIFNPTTDLTAGLLYTATITTGAKNLLGTPLANNYVWTFTTGSVPTVISTDPLNNASDVPLNKNVSATFSEAMNAGTLNTTTFTVKQGANAVTGLVTYLGTTATFSPNNDFNENLVYTATITTGAKNTSGNGLANDFVWNFTTGAAPQVIATDPANLATNVALNKTITASFSEAMNPATITNLTFTVSKGTTNISGTISYNGTTATFNPTSNLESGATYKGTITTGAKDLTGNALASNYTWTFNTAAPAGPAGVNLGSAGNFAILAGAGVTNTGLTIVTGDLGTSPTGTVVGFPPGIVNGTIHAANPTAAAAKLDLTTAYNDAQGRSLNAISLPGDLSGLTLAPGLYINSTSVMVSTGNLTLDAQGDINAVFILKMGSTFTTMPGTGMVLSGGAQAKNIYWSVGTSATLGTNSVCYGNILADQSISLNTGATLNGRALTRIASVTLQSNIVTKP